MKVIRTWSYFFAKIKVRKQKKVTRVTKMDSPLKQGLKNNSTRTVSQYSVLLISLRQTKKYMRETLPDHSMEL